MDQKVVIKEEPLWLEGAERISFERVELESAEAHVKEETRPELTEPGPSQVNTLELVPQTDVPLHGAANCEKTAEQVSICDPSFKSCESAPYVKEELTIEEHVTDQLIQHIKEEKRVEIIAVDTCNSPPDNVYNEELLSRSMGDAIHCNERGMKSNLTEHLLTDTGDTPHNCNECGKMFSNKKSVNHHLRAHGKKLYRCNLCSKSFPFKSFLNNHLLIHNRECLYSCSECGKKFHTERVRNQHVLTHTGERPHKCNICGSTFLLKSSLNGHMSCHRVERRFKCIECGRSIRSESAFSEHMLTHNNEFYLLFN